MKTKEHLSPQYGGLGSIDTPKSNIESVLAVS